jgi:hypothetical protein
LKRVWASGVAMAPGITLVVRPDAASVTVLEKYPPKR